MHPEPTVDVTAEIIREVALAHFARTGYDGATMRGIAAEVGVKASSLYHHFPSKQDLLWDLTLTALDGLEAGWARARSALPDPHSRRDELEAFVTSHVRFHATHSAQAAMVNGHLHGLDSVRYRLAVTRRDRYAAALTDLLTAGRDEGVFDIPDMQITTYALLQMGMSVATWYRPDGPRSIAELCSGYVAVAMKIVQPQQGKQQGKRRGISSRATKPGERDT